MSEQLQTYANYLAAFLKGDEATAKAYLAQLPDGIWEGTGKLNMGVFGAAVEKRFAQDPSHGAVKTFVSDFMAGVKESGETVKSIHVELLVRAFLGETDLFYEVPGDDGNKIMPPAAHLMVVNVGLSPAEIDELVVSAYHSAIQEL